LIALAGFVMDSILGALQLIITVLLTFVMWVVIAYVILTWLIGFQVINLRNRFVYQVSRFLEAVATPLLRPFRRLIPSIGGLDFSPLILIVLIQVLLGGSDGRNFGYLAPIPALFLWLHGLVGGGVGV
jgi:YggT family protein